MLLKHGADNTARSKCFMYIRHAQTHKELQTIGQLRKGDVLALRAFVEGKPNKTERDEKKRKLLETLKGKLPRKKEQI